MPDAGAARRPRRLPAIGVLVALAAAAVMADARVDDASVEPRVEGPEAPARATAPGTLSAAWYCAEGTSVRSGRADEVVVIANASPRPADAIVTVMPGAGQEIVRKRVTAPARSATRVAVSDLIRTGDPGVVVEVFGEEMAVEHELSGPGDVAVAPCASRASDRWYFAAGSTAKDARQYLAVFNPFGEDAVVDIAFFTDEGPKHLESLSGLVIPARSRFTARVHALVRRQDHVATEVLVRTGRVVAEQSNIYEGGGRQGLTVLPGALGPAEQSVFAEGIVAPGVREEVSILNPSGEGAVVGFEVHADGDALIEPEELEIPPNAAVTVNVGDKVPEGVGHFVVVRSLVGEVVAAQTVWSGRPAPNTGAAMVAPAVAPARRWLFASGRSDAERDEWIVGANLGSARATLSLRVLAAGQLLVPQGLGSLSLDPDGRRNVRLGDALQRAEVPLVVCSDRPVFMTRGLYGGGIDLGYGIPMAADGDDECLGAG